MTMVAGLTHIVLLTSTDIPRRVRALFMDQLLDVSLRAVIDTVNTLTNSPIVALLRAVVSSDRISE